MNRVLVYEDTKGYCRVIYPASHFQCSWETEEDALFRLRETAIPETAEFLCCRQSVLPDKTFRRAWKKGDTNEPVKIDMALCMEIHRERLRQASNSKISELDLQLERALEDDNLPWAVSIRRTKKALRSMHEMNLTHCKTPQDVKYSIPKELHDVWSFYPPIFANS